ncbi:MAG: SPOR domain-containing protein [Bdellovibrionales bacterium]|nr:SPOR domain-containing protein [Bdellovibrionales bacterium]NQZ19000.1 SPOR domain-containing protein [Bdellovibrionales bacterium]
MKRKGKESRVNVALTALLVFFVCLLCFSIGVISGKGWSDRDYKVKHIENDNHLKQAMSDTAPIGDDMTAKEVELLTKKALQEARAVAPAPTVDPEPEQKPLGSDASTAKVDGAPEGEKMDNLQAAMAANDKQPVSVDGQAVEKKEERKVSSLPPRPTTPKPTSIEYTVQVASYKTMDEAERHSQKLINKGFPAYPVKTKIKDQIWYRVSIGSFKNRKQAVKYQRDLKKQAMVKTSFVRKIERQ